MNEQEREDSLLFMAKQAIAHNMSVRCLIFTVEERVLSEAGADRAQLSFMARLHVQAREPHNTFDIHGEQCDSREEAVESAKKAFEEAMHV